MERSGLAAVRSDVSERQILDPAEEHFRIQGPRSGLRLFLCRLPAIRASGARSCPVLYVHGATFPSALSVAYRFGGRSWRDALCAAGFNVWALDFYGFGESDRYPELAEPADHHSPLCVAADAAEQLTAAIQFILNYERAARVSVISHSWGSMPVGIVSSTHPTLIERWALFAPIGRRAPRRYEQPPNLPAWRLVSLDDQWTRFVEDVPPHEVPVLSRHEFEAWGEAYLDSDPQSRTRNPPSVKIPLGPFSEILRAWHGVLPYDPARVEAPIAILRGAWDGLLPDDESRALFDSFSHVSNKRDVKIGRATHLMHLETMRWALWRESIAFLLGDDVAPVP
jgi:pimeloyl-ACP methyl ester carboxylesterase